MLSNPEDKEILIKWGGTGGEKMYEPDIALLKAENAFNAFRIALISIACSSPLFGKEV